MDNINYIINTYKLLKLDGKDIRSIYLYAIAAGLISLGLPLGIQAILGFVMASQLSTSLVLLIVVVILATFFYGLFQIKQLQLIEKMKQKIYARFALAFKEKLDVLDLQKNKSYYLPELMNRFFEILNYQKSLSKLLLDIPASTIQIILGLILLSFYHPFFMLFGFLLLLILFIFLRLTVVKGMRTSVAESDYKYQFAHWLENYAANAKDTRGQAFHELNLEQTNEMLSSYIHSRTAHFKILKVQYWSLVLFKVFITGAMLLVGVYLLLQQLINIGQFVASEIVIILLISSIEKMIFGLDNAYDLFTSTKKLYDIFDLPEVNKSQKETLISTKADVIELENVSLVNEAGDYLLQNISLTLHKGDLCYISGISGSGKSSLIKILTGIYSNYQGRISIDDVVVSDNLAVTISSYTSCMYQDAQLIEGSVYTNIILGNKDISLAEVINLSKQLGFHEYILSLPNAYQTIVNRNKTNISSAVTNMLLILRTMIRDTPIYIFEVPFVHFEKELSISIVNAWKAHFSDKIILYTSSQTYMEPLANKYLILSKGGLVHLGSNK